jgi:hypothetical protein
MKIKPGDRYVIPPSFKGEKEIYITIIKIHKLTRQVRCVADNIHIPLFFLSFKRLAELKKI